MEIPSSDRENQSFCPACVFERAVTILAEEEVGIQRSHLRGPVQRQTHTLPVSSSGACFILEKFERPGTSLKKKLSSPWKCVACVAWTPDQLLNSRNKGKLDEKEADVEGGDGGRVGAGGGYAPREMLGKAEFHKERRGRQRNKERGKKNQRGDNTLQRPRAEDPKNCLHR